MDRSPTPSARPGFRWSGSWIYRPGCLALGPLPAGNNFLGDCFQVPDPVFSGTGDAEHDVARAGVDILLKTGHAAIHRAQQTIFLDNVFKTAAVNIAASERIGGHISRFFHRWVDGNLASRGLLQHFDSIKCSDDVSRVKPDPELYLLSVSQLRTRPKNVVVIEDSANGVTAAKRAGLFCVVVPNPMTKDLPIDHADLRLDALSDMALGSLLSKADGDQG